MSKLTISPSQVGAFSYFTNATLQPDYRELHLCYNKTATMRPVLARGFLAAVLNAVLLRVGGKMLMARSVTFCFGGCSWHDADPSHALTVWFLTSWNPILEISHCLSDKRAFLKTDRIKTSRVSDCHTFGEPCRLDLSIGHGGFNDVTKHLGSSKHQKCSRIVDSSPTLTGHFGGNQPLANQLFQAETADDVVLSHALRKRVRAHSLKFSGGHSPCRPPVRGSLTPSHTPPMQQHLWRRIVGFADCVTFSCWVCPSFSV